MSARTLLNAAIVEHNRIHAEIAAGYQRVTDLDGRAADADARAEAERAAAAEADAVAIAEGRKPAPRVAVPGADAAREAAASRRGAELVRAEFPAKERALADAKRDVVDTALTTFCLERNVGHLEVLAAVDALGLALARLLAADLAREALTGRRFAFDPARHPPAELWLPRPLVEALVAAMPPRFSPDGWANGIKRGALALAAKMNGGSE